MFKPIIYIEKDVLKSKSTKQIVDIIKPTDIVVIDNYKEVLNQTNSNWHFNKQFQKFILAKRKDEFYYKGSYLTSDMNQKYFYYNTLALNCLYHCEYCYLQGMYNTPHLVMFLNNKDFITATKNLLKQTKEKIYLALSYDTDLPALEKYYPYCKEWIEFANKEKNITIEIRTKSNNTEFIENSKPSENVILSFTLSPIEIQKKYEPFTPSLKQRLDTLKFALNKGFKIMICIDPIIYIPDYKEVYSSFINEIAKEIPLSENISASIGVFRMNNDFLKRIRKNGNTSDLMYYNYEVKNKVATYPENIRKEMIMFVKNELIKNGLKNIYIYV